MPDDDQAVREFRDARWLKLLDEAKDDPEHLRTLLIMRKVMEENREVLEWLAKS